MVEWDMMVRRGSVSRETSETSINLELVIDGRGKFEVDTGIRFLDHLLSQMAFQGIFDLRLKATGDYSHHVAEDVAICLGQALSQALGERKGIRRMASSIVPMDEALSLVAIDIGGRGYAVVEASFPERIENLEGDLIRHFLETFALHGQLNLQAFTLRGKSGHHKAESLFKALGKALREAVEIDPRRGDRPSSTKD